VDLSGPAFYQSTIEYVYDGLAALDCTPFAWSDSDRFRQARYLDAERGGTRHLEVWFDLGRMTAPAPTLVHESQLVIVHRYSPDDDSLAQARIHAATRAVMDWLEQARPPGGLRFRPTAYDVEAISAEWVATRVSIETRIPRTSR